MIKVCNPINSVELVYTEKCNLFCDHCIADASPEKERKIDYKKVLPLIKDFPRYGIKRLGITGGEPFLFLDELVELCSVASKKGVNFRVVTNGFWASSEKETERIMAEFYSAGLREMDVSTDDFHSKFIPEKNINNIINAVKKRKDFTLILRCCFKEKTDVLSFIAKHKTYAKALSKKHFHSFFQPLSPLGRALEKLPYDSYKLAENFDNKCFLLGKLVINFDGKLVACCNNSQFSDAFVLGDFYKSSFRDLVDIYRNSLFVFYLINKGPVPLFELIKKHRLKRVRKVPNPLSGYVSMCDFCQKNLVNFSAKDINLMLEKEFESDLELKKLAKKSLKKSKK